MIAPYIEQANAASARKDLATLLRLAAELDLIAESEGDKTATAYAMLFRGFVESMSDRYPEALELFERVIPLFERLNDASGHSRALLNIGRIHTFRDDSAAAIDCFNRALAKLGDSGDWESIERVLSNYSAMLLKESRWTEYVALHERLADEFSNRGNNAIAGHVLNRLSFACMIRKSDAHGAMKYATRAYDLHERAGDVAGMAGSLDGLGGAYWYLGEAGKSAEYSMRSVALAEESGDLGVLGQSLTNAAYPFMQLEDYNKVLELNQRAIDLYHKAERGADTGWAEMGLGLALIRLGNPADALAHSLRAVELLTHIGDSHGLGYAYNRCGEAYVALGQYEEAFTSFQKSLENRKLVTAFLEIAETQADIAKILLHKGEVTEAIELLYEALTTAESFSGKAVIYAIHKTFAELYSKQGQYETAFKHLQLYLTIRDDVQNQESAKRASSVEYLHKQELHRREQEATDRILHNVLPRSISDRLKAGQILIADTIPAVSVLFVDIVGFTPIAAQLTAEELVKLLAYVFGKFDDVCALYGLEKIKTIGDAYMAVAGAPDPCDDHALRCARAALDIMNLNFDDDRLAFRIGVHTGSAVAGVIGERRFAYDLWGDTINIAARMESHGESGMIHVTEDYVSELRKHLNGNSKDFTFQERGELEIKGKGAMRTYYLIGDLP